MPPAYKRKNSDDPALDNWWRNAYVHNDNITVQYELQFGKDLLKPGTKIKIKYMRGVFRFRCLAHNIPLDRTWIDCLDVEAGSWHSFRVDQIKRVVKPKRSRAKKTNA